jgi:hypothetical protein
MNLVSGAIAAALAATAVSVGAQNPPVRTLAGPVAELPDAFLEVSAVRELPDGRVIVVDGNEFAVYVADFRSGRREQLGRNGRGPGEYLLPTRLYELPGDSTAVLDEGQAHLLVMDGTARFVTTIYLLGNTPGVRPDFTRAIIEGVDDAGRYYGRAMPIRIRSGGIRELTDSAAIQRWTSASPRRDTVAYVPVEPDPTRRLVAGSVVSRPSNRAFRTAPQWAVSRDGRIAVVDWNPYQVTFVHPDGRVVRGQPINYQRVRVTREVREAFPEAEARPRPFLASPRGGGAPFVTLRKRSRTTEDAWEFPEFLPPFLQRAVQFDRGGRLWIQRTTPHCAATSFDVVDDSGSAAERVVLPQQARLIGFGEGVAYLVRLDQDDLQFLQKYRLPPR